MTFGGRGQECGGNSGVYVCVRGTDDLSVETRLITLLVLHRFKRCLPDNPNNEPMGEMEADAQEHSTDEACVIKH